MIAAIVSDQFSYRRHEVPRDYFCAWCKMQGVRLYREYGGFSPGEILCTHCTEKSQDRKFDPNSPHEIAWRVAAVPCEDGTGYWGYTSVPQEGVNWWDLLPVSTLE